jgi:hypothetical protein
MKDNLSLCHTYLDAKRSVIEAGFGWELDWQSQLSFDEVSEQHFLREYTWVVFNAGFREQIIRRIFPVLEIAFANFESAATILNTKHFCRRKALSIFRHKQKVNAIFRTCHIIVEKGFSNIHAEIKRHGANLLREFPFMGPATSLHLAKNLGLNVAKPDRHLLRLAAATGHKTPHEMCENVHKIVGDPISEIDLVFWRFATLNPQWIKSVELNARNSWRASIVSLLEQKAIHGKVSSNCAGPYLKG